jgi:glycosyltransferase involved in cell wall biosynthesis
MKKPILYIVIPCYNEEEVIEETSRRIGQVIERMISEQLVDSDSRMLCVDDGSRDRTWELITHLHATTPHVCGVKLAANSGHQNALMAGLFTACEHADIMVSIDADLQDDVEVIPEMVRKYHEGCDIVYGVRRSRATDTWFKRNTALGFYKFMKSLGVKSVYNHADYRLMSRRAVEQLSKYRERNLFLRGLVPLIGYKSDNVYFDRAKRFAGESKYPLKKMLNFAVDGITSFSIQPLRLLFHIGLLFIFISIGIFIWVLWRYLNDQVVPGWSSIILSIWFVGGSILMGMGIMGEYIGKMYLEVKDRPRYNIETTLINKA